MKLFRDEDYTVVTVRAKEDFILHEFADIYLQGIFEITVKAGDGFRLTCRDRDYSIKYIDLNDEILGENGFNMTADAVLKHCERA